MKISAVNSYNFNKINFEGKKAKAQAPTHSASPIKSIPLAVLLAMSPLNAPKAETTTIDNIKWSYYYGSQNVVIKQQMFDHVTPGNEYKCTMKILSNDGNNNTTELLTLVFEKDYDALKHDKNGNNVRYGTNHFSREIGFDSLIKEEHNVKNDDGTKTKFFKYYVEGPCLDKTKTIDDKTGNITGVSTVKLNKASVEITKDFYDALLPIAIFYRNAASNKQE